MLAWHITVSLKSTKIGERLPRRKLNNSNVKERNLRGNPEQDGLGRYRKMYGERKQLGGN
jgi:hypothetical protein